MKRRKEPRIPGDDRTSSRPYERGWDLALLRGFLLGIDGKWPSTVVLASRGPHMDHVPEHALRPARKSRLWEDGEGVAGFAILEEPDGMVAQVRPVHRGVLEETMLRWAAERLADPVRNLEAEIWTRALDTGRHFTALLDRLGFRRDEDHAVKMHRRLDKHIPETPLPKGWKVRPVGGEEEW